jgi:hypothetical protein
MIPTRQDVLDSMSVLVAYENLKTEEQVKLVLAADIAKQMFPEFKTMRPEEQADIITMLLEDMSIDMYKLN